MGVFWGDDLESTIMARNACIVAAMKAAWMLEDLEPEGEG